MENILSVIAVGTIIAFAVITFLMIGSIDNAVDSIADCYVNNNCKYTSFWGD